MRQHEQPGGRHDARGDHHRGARALHVRSGSHVASVKMSNERRRSESAQVLEGVTSAADFIPSREKRRRRGSPGRKTMQNACLYGFLTVSLQRSPEGGGNVCWLCIYKVLHPGVVPVPRELVPPPGAQHHPLRVRFFGSPLSMSSHPYEHTHRRRRRD